MAKHRAPRYVRTRKAMSTVPVAAGATAVGLGVLTTPAQAATSHDWSGVAQCESSGNWAINNGNGFYGGLQFTQSTWAGFGGTAFAPRADLATPAQQVQIAEKVLAGQGIGAWPVCGKHLTGGTTNAAPVAPQPAPAPVAPQPAPAPVAPQPAPAPVAPQAAPAPVAPKAAPAAPKHAAPETSAQTHQASPRTISAPKHAVPEGPAAGTYTVQAGDTLSEIAASHGVTGGWQQIWDGNRDVVADPDLIFPGEKLSL